MSAPGGRPPSPRLGSGARRGGDGMMVAGSPPAQECGRGAPPGYVVTPFVSPWMVVSAALFLVSGACGLAYEVVWAKLLGHVWGSTGLAIACVVSALLLGLGAGAFLGGRLCTGGRDGLAWYGYCELCLAACAAAVPSGIEFSGEMLLGAQGWIGEGPGQRGLLFTLLTLLLVGAPATLMGATLPFLSSAVAFRERRVAGRLGLLYCANLLGAAAGSLMAGFVAIPRFGLGWTYYGTVLISALVGLAALGLRRSRLARGPVEAPGPGEPSPGEPPPGHPPPPTVRSGAIMPAMILCGASSIGMQVIWNREMAMVLGGSGYAFAAILFVVLSGIGAGAWCYERFLACAPTRESVPQVAALTLAGLWLGQLAVANVADLAGALMPFRGTTLGNAGVCIALTVPVVLLPSIGFGVLFPALATRNIRALGSHGRDLGAAYLANSLGNAAGGLVVGLILLPRAGLGPSALACGLLVMVGCTAVVRPFGWTAHPVAAAVAALAALGLTCDPVASTRARVTAGQFLEGHLDDAELRGVHNVLFHRDGASCSVTVAEARGGDRNIRVNGKVDGSTKSDMKTQVGLALFPALAKPDSTRTLIIGYGTGTTLGAALGLLDGEVVCAEIEPAVIEASPLFRKWNHMHDGAARGRIVVNDGRNLLASDPGRYDLIISEPSNPWVAGVGSLFTEEFYEVARKRLRKGGVLAQWCQLYALSPDEYAMIVRTVMKGFRCGAWVRINEADTVLLASMEPIVIDASALAKLDARLKRNRALGGAIEGVFGTTNLAQIVAEHVLMDERGLRHCAERAGATETNTDWNLSLESAAPLRVFGRVRGKNNAWSRLINRVVLGGFSAEEYAERARRLGDVEGVKRSLRRVSAMAESLESPGLELEVARAAHLVDPGDVYWRVRSRWADEDMEDADWESAIGTLCERDPEVATEIGVRLWSEKRYRRAATVFGAICNRKGAAANAWANLAVNRLELGEVDGAREASRRACELDPTNRFVLDIEQRVKRSDGGGASGR